MELSDLSQWFRGNGLEIFLILIGATLCGRFIQWVANAVIRHSETQLNRSGALLSTSEDIKHKRSLVQMIAWATTATVGFVAAVLVLQRFNVPLTSIVAPATVLGAALGFGSQRVVQDLLSGFFLFTERQYGIGDVIRISQPGTTKGVSGTVEALTLRSTQLRTVNGEVVTLPNGQILQVTNLSRNWAQVVLDIPIARDVNIQDATVILTEVGDEMKGDEDWTNRILTTPAVQGVESFGVDFFELRLVTRVLPGAQWEVSRELRARILPRLRDAGIELRESFEKVSV